MPKPFFSNIESIIRVNHAGELGAKYIYLGQMRFIEKKYKELIKEMLLQELEHLDYFEKKMTSIRPTILISFWKKVGYGLGALSGISGIRNSMILTEAIETAISIHYTQQEQFLMRFGDRYRELRKKIAKFREDESDHQNKASEFGMKRKYVENIFFQLIFYCCKIAIYISKRI